jgi:hypothetical protein
MSANEAEKPLPDAQSPDIKEWFYAQGGMTYGPVTSSDLRVAAHLGFIGPNDLVRRSNQNTWTPAHSIKGLFEETA